MAMALKLIQRTPLLWQIGIHHGPPAGLVCPFTRILRTSSSGQTPCVACGSLSSPSADLLTLTTIAGEPSFVAGSSVGLHKDSAPRFRLTQMRRPDSDTEPLFLELVGKCSSSQQVFKLLRSVETLSDGMAAAALHRVADLEQEGTGLKDPAVLDNDTIRVLCFQLEQDSRRLTDAGLVSALLACTRLFLDPRSTLMVRLVSESQQRLDSGRMSIGQLCTLGQAMLAIEGPGSVMLEQVLEQIQTRKPPRWSLSELVAVYKLLLGALGKDGKHRDLLNAMHIHALTVTHQMDPAAVSVLLHCLVTLDQKTAVALVIGLCKQAVRHVPHFTDQELTMVTGALIHFGYSDRYFVEAMERHVPKVAFTAHPDLITKVAQFFAGRKILSPAVFDAIAESFVYRANDYSTAQVAGQIAAFGKLGYVPPNAADVFRTVEKVLHARVSQFQPRTLVNLLHACTLVQRFPVNFVSKVFNSYFLLQLHEQEAEMDRYIRAQVTQLHMALRLECPSYKGPRLHPEYRVQSFLVPGHSLETPVDNHLYNLVKNGLIQLLAARSLFASRVRTPYCYTLDVEIKLDAEGFVLPAHQTDEVYTRIALCIDGAKRFTADGRQLLGGEATKQRHLRLLGYEVVQIPFYEFEKLWDKSSVVEFLHKKIFPHTYRHSW